MFRSIIGGVGHAIGHVAQNMWQSLFTDSVESDSDAGVELGADACVGELAKKDGYNWRTGEDDGGLDPGGWYDKQSLL